MQSVILCEFCDCEINEGDTECYVCEAPVTKKANSRDLKIQSDELLGNNTNSILKCDTEILTRNVVGIKSDGLHVTAHSDEAFWNCTECNYRNKLQDTTCPICSQTRIGVEGTKSVHREDPPNEWVCNSCEFNNPITSRFCEVCYDNNEDNEANISELIDINDDVSLDHRWKCLSCSFMNYMIALRCFACEQNNQIFRQCTNCVQAFIMNNTDTLCVDCLGDCRIPATGRVMSRVLPKRKKPWICKGEFCRVKNNGKFNQCKNCKQNRWHNTPQNYQRHENVGQNSLHNK